MSDIVGAAGVTIEPEGFEDFEAALEAGVQQALRAIEQEIGRVESRLGEAVQQARDLDSALEQVDPGEIDVPVSASGEEQITADVNSAIDAADEQVTVEGEAQDLTGDVEGAIDAADSGVVITGDAGDITGSIDDAISAADRDINLEVEAGSLAEITGEISETATAVGGELAEAITGVQGELAETQASLGQNVDEAGFLTRNLGGVKGAVLGIGGAVAGLGLTSFFKDAVSGASELEESANKAQVVFGEDLIGAIRDFGATADESVGLSEQAALDATATFGNLFTSLGVTKDEAAEMSPELVQLAADMASFNDLAGGAPQALDALRSGIVGEIEPLRRLGVAFNAEEVNAKAVELQLAETTSEVDESAKIQARYALILERSANQQGDFARTADSLANRQRSVTAEFQNTVAAIGESLQPVVLGFLDTAEALLPVLETVGDALAQGIIAVAPVVQGVVEGLAPVLELVGQALQDLFEAAGPGLEELGDAIGQALGSLAPILEPLAPLVGLFGQNLGTIAGIAADLLQALQPLLDLLASLITIALAPIIPLAEGAALAFGAIGDVFGIVVDAVVPLLENFGPLGAFVELVGRVGDILPNVGGASDRTAQAQTNMAAEIDKVSTALFGQTDAVGDVQGALTGLEANLNEFLITESLFAEKEMLGGLNEAGISVDRLAGDLKAGEQGLSRFLAELQRSGDIAFHAKEGSDLLNFSQKELADAFEAGTLTVDRFFELGGQLDNDARVWIKTFRDQSIAVQEGAREQLDAAVASGTFSQAQLDAAKAIAEAEDGAATQADKLRILSTDIDTVNEKVHELTGEYIDQDEKQRALAQGLVDLGNQALTTGVAEDELKAKAEELGVSQDQLTEFTDELTQSFKDFQDQLAESIPTVSEVVDTGLGELNAAVDEQVSALEERIGENAVPGQLEEQRARMEAALRPDFIIDSLESQVEALGNYQENVKFLIDSGFDAVAEEAITRGPEFTNELVTSIQQGRPGLGAELEASFDLYEQEAGETETFLREVAAPALFDASALMAQLAKEGFDVNLNFDAGAVAALDEAELGIRAQQGKIAAATELVARGADTAFLEGIDFGGTTIADIREAQDALVAQVPGIEGAAGAAGGAATSGYGGGLDLGGATVGGAEQAELILKGLGLSGTSLEFESVAAGERVGAAFAAGIGVGMIEATAPGGPLDTNTRILVNTIESTAIAEASDSPPFFRTGKQFAEGLAGGFAANVGPLLSGVFGDIDAAAAPIQAGVASVGSRLATGGDTGEFRSASAPRASDSGPVTIQMTNEFTRDPDPDQIAQAIGWRLTGRRR